MLRRAGPGPASTDGVVKMTEPSNEPTEAPQPGPGDAYPEYGVPVEPVVPVAVGKSDPVRGILAGIGTAVLGAILWTLIGYVTNYEIGFAAVGLGFAVGFVVHQVGGHASMGTAIAAAAVAIVGVVAGFLMLDIALLAKDQDVSFFTAYSEIGSLVGWPEALRTSLATPLRWLFLAIAGYGAFGQVAQRVVRRQR